MNKNMYKKGRMLVLMGLFFNTIFGFLNYLGSESSLFTVSGGLRILFVILLLVSVGILMYGFRLISKSKREQNKNDLQA